MTTIRKNSINIDYAGNLRKQLGVRDSGADTLKKAFGLLKGKIKKTSVSYQRELRKEWERKA
ncbi:MAG: hypothetical protein A2937_03055 [Candidatus Yonathbacteria bacterium RIFCSPLOWO2_01_FULL_47_33b]|uniref:Uncharacterized protein n=1 Tax=Candidatus Yonathbacteria bacterium RIFCSPLOWO2_01_FULL_47_33b TaxID=1802727 RepID=A0A1G2SCN8_9BACT|nr:MAG: hypothetical protein A2937_03055 [Candidatus Yonathbacteria bacterium RIFCSPLOWO2_01_FULL_47_33b]